MRSYSQKDRNEVFRGQSNTSKGLEVVGSGRFFSTPGCPVLVYTVNYIGVLVCVSCVFPGRVDGVRSGVSVQGTKNRVYSVILVVTFRVCEL